MKTELKLEGHTVQFEDTPEMHKKVFEAVLAYFKQEDHWSGEGLYQSDSAQVEGLELIADLADKVIKFKVTYDE